MVNQSDLETLAQSFLSALGLSLSMTIEEKEDSVLISFEGRDSYLLTERQGAVLDALQLLLGKVAEVQLGVSKRLVIDCEGFRQGKEEELIELARHLAAKVRTTRQPQELGPYNSYERRLIHLALKEESGVATESQGDGFIKTIVIRPA